MSDWIDELAIETFNEHALAGLALGVVRDGRLDHFAGLGLADAEDTRPVDSRTVFRIGSISKTMTAIAVMQLVEQGRLALTSVGFAPHELAEKVLERLLGVEDDTPPLVAGRPHEWPALTGLYKVPRGLNTNLRWWPMIGAEVEIAVRSGHLVARAPSPVKELRKGFRLHPVAADGLRFEARHGDWRIPVAFERGAHDDAVAVRAGSARGGLLRLERRAKATSVRLWGRAVLGAGAVGAAAAAARWRRR